jgi:hypothetical protein
MGFTLLNFAALTNLTALCEDHPYLSRNMEIIDRILFLL